MDSLSNVKTILLLPPDYKIPDEAGSIFVVETKFRGVPETKFRYR